MVFHDAQRGGETCDAAIELPETQSDDAFVLDLDAHYDEYRAQAEENERSGALLRELAYNSRKCVSFEGEALTVTEAARLWEYYAAENNVEVMSALTSLIADAKAAIREEYP